MILHFHKFIVLDDELLYLLEELEDQDNQLTPYQLTQTKEKVPLNKPSSNQYFATSNSIEPLPSNDPNRFRKLKGRKRAVNVKKINELRIVKRDIRRRYIEMYNNVMNIHDPSLLSRFLNDVCTPTCSFTIGLPGNRPTLVRKGINEILLHTMESHMKIPDGVQCLSNGKIHVCLEKPGSRIISFASFRGTALYKFRVEMELEKSGQPSPRKYASDLSSFPSSLMMEEVEDVIENPSIAEEKKDDFADQTQLTIIPAFDPFPLLLAIQPMEIMTSGLLTMVLDDTNRIENFHMDINYFHQKEVTSFSPLE